MLKRIYLEFRQSDKYKPHVGFFLDLNKVRVLLTCGSSRLVLVISAWYYPFLGSPNFDVCTRTDLTQTLYSMVGTRILVSNEVVHFRYFSNNCKRLFPFGSQSFNG